MIGKKNGSSGNVGGVWTGGSMSREKKREGGVAWNFRRKMRKESR